MRALIQRVSEACVRVDGEVIGHCGPGLMILVCAMDGDDATAATTLAQKVSKLRIFKDDADKMNRSILDVAGQALVVSQFTLAADTRRGNRPSFISAAPPDQANALYEAFTAHLRSLGVPCATGQFAANMQVALTNDGPVTIWLDTQDV